MQKGKENKSPPPAATGGDEKSENQKKKDAKKAEKANKKDSEKALKKALDACFKTGCSVADVEDIVCKAVKNRKK